jgi:hypothetical protein
VKTEDILNLIRMCDEALKEGEANIDDIVCTPVKQLVVEEK